jgi:hypothetical protein
MDWHTCAYRFRLGGSTRVTDGVQYLAWNEDNIYQSVVVTGVTPNTPTATPTSTDTPAIPTDTPTEKPTEAPTETPVNPTDTPTEKPTEGPTDTATMTPKVTSTLTPTPSEPTMTPTEIVGLVGDLNGDGSVDDKDLLLLMGQWHKKSAQTPLPH